MVALVPLKQHTVQPQGQQRLNTVGGHGMRKPSAIEEEQDMQSEEEESEEDDSDFFQLKDGEEQQSEGSLSFIGEDGLAGMAAGKFHSIFLFKRRVFSVGKNKCGMLGLSSRLENLRCWEPKEMLFFTINVSHVFNQECSALRSKCSLVERATASHGAAPAASTRGGRAATVVWATRSRRRVTSSSLASSRTCQRSTCVARRVGRRTLSR